MGGLTPAERAPARKPPAARKAPARAKAAPAPAPAPDPEWLPAPVYYQQVPQFIPERPRLERWTSTELRIAMCLFVAGLVAVFVRQMPFLAQVVVGAPIFEEAFKLGLALLPWAALKVRSLAARLPTALAVGAAFGVFEHHFSYSGEPLQFYATRTAFHALTCAVSLLALHTLHDADSRLRPAAIAPSTFVHAFNNTMAVVIGVAGGAFAEAAVERVAFGFAVGVLTILGSLLLTSPAWAPRLRAGLERHVLPRLT